MLTSHDADHERRVTEHGLGVNVNAVLEKPLDCFRLPLRGQALDDVRRLIKVDTLDARSRG